MKKRPCEQEWSMEKATGVRELIEELSGQACPCDRGLRCPLFPDLEIRTIKVRPGAALRVA